MEQSATSQGLHGARFAPPRAPPAAVERARLVEQIERADVKLTLICAPAGYGKTTLMQQLRKRYQARGITTVWLRLGAGDNSLGAFVQSLTGAMHATLPESAARPDLPDLEAMGSPQGLAADLIERLSLAEAEIAVFLDELEILVAEGVWAFLQRFIGEIDGRHRLVMASRSTPNLALARMRAQGEALELGQADMRFTAEETYAYLERQSVGASAAQALQQRTEGWPAALQLAAVALKAKGGRDFDGLRPSVRADPAVAEYLAEEVLETRPPSQRDFLLRSAVLGEFSSEMCDAALGRTDSAEMIAEVLRNNLLLSPIDAEHRWYRYHPLFADFLHARMESEAKAELPLLHRRAAAWTAERGLTDEAVSHALAARDYEFAADLLTTTAMDKVRSGRVADTARGVEALPEAVVLGRPALLRAAAFAAIFAHRYDAARRYMNAIERSEDAVRGVADDIAAMRLMLFGWTDRVRDLLQAVRSLRTQAPRFGAFTRGLAGNASAFCNIALGRLVEAERDLAETREACEPINALYVLSYAACFSAAIELNQGQVASARATLVGALDRAIAEGQRYGSSGAVVATYLIELLYEANELDVCQSLVEAYLPIVAETGMPDHLILTYRIAARLHFLHGQRDAGLATLLQLNELGARRGIRRLSAAAWLERSYAALRDKDIQSARRFLANGADPALWEQFSGLNMHASEVEDVAIAEIRVCLASGETKQALGQVQTVRGIAEAAGRRRRVLRLRFLEAQSLESLGRGREAGAALNAAVAAAVEGGMARVLLDECWATDALIARAHSTGDSRATSLLRQMAEPTATADAAAGHGRATPAFRLTSREAQILRLVWKGGANKAIARDLFLTENTVETHLRRIFGKLGTRNRTQAAALAREAGAI